MSKNIRNESRTKTFSGKKNKIILSSTAVHSPKSNSALKFKKGFKIVT